MHKKKKKHFVLWPGKRCLRGVSLQGLQPQRASWQRATLPPAGRRRKNGRRRHAGEGRRWWEGNKKINKCEEGFVSERQTFSMYWHFSSVKWNYFNPRNSFLLLWGFLKAEAKRKIPGPDDSCLWAPAVNLRPGSLRWVPAVVQQVCLEL